MGIQGLLPFLKKASRHANIKEFKGCTVAIDSYCWLHRGAFACAEKLALGESTDQYVYYCMKYVNNLLSFGIKPIMVFDGCRLPSKHDVEQSRRERRAMNRKKAAQLLSEGKRTEARDCLAQCIDISPQMALQLMNACREKGVDCIVAPYEADAQLAYLSKIGVVQVVITEDSDLVLFGCDRIMFKMDIAGNGMLIEKRDLNSAMCLPPEIFTFEKFRQACILSGCDYLPSLPGIGLAKATKVFRLSRQADMATLIKKIPSTLKMSNLQVPVDYVDGFFKAENSFLYQLVFDPILRKLVPLNPYPDNIDPADLYYAGPYIENDKALQIALGNIDINTGERHAYFDPDSFKIKSTSWNQENLPHFQSVWSRNYRPMLEPFRSTHDIKPVEQPNTKGMEVVIKLSELRNKFNRGKRKETAVEEIVETTEQDLMNMYGQSQPCEAIQRNNSSAQCESSDELNSSCPPIKRRCSTSVLSECEPNVSLYNENLVEECNVPPEDASFPSSPHKLEVQASSPEKSSERSSPLKSSYRSSNKENDALDNTVPVSPANRTDHVDHFQIRDECSSKSPAKRKNIFAVGSNVGLRPRFSLNASKITTKEVETRVEVRSRFFVRDETKLCADVTTGVSNVGQGDGRHKKANCETAQQLVNNRRIGLFCASTKAEPGVGSSPYRAFGFTKSVSSHVGSEQTNRLSNLSSIDSNKPFKAVIPNVMTEIPSTDKPSRCLTENHSIVAEPMSRESNVVELLDVSDNEYSDEDPFKSSTPQCKFSQSFSIRNSSERHCTQLNKSDSAPLSSPPSKPVVGAVARISRSLNEAKQQKSVPGSRVQSNGCRTSGLTKVKRTTENGCNADDGGGKQSSISKYFQSKFAFSKQSSHINELMVEVGCRTCGQMK